MNPYKAPPMPSNEHIKESWTIIRGRMVFDEYFRPNGVKAPALVAAALETKPQDFDDFEEFKETAIAKIKALLPEDCAITEKELMAIMAMVTIPALKEAKRERKMRQEIN